MVVFGFDGWLRNDVLRFGLAYRLFCFLVFVLIFWWCWFILKLGSLIILLVVLINFFA